MNRFCIIYHLFFFITVTTYGRAQIELLHSTMDIRIGYPAIIAPGGDYPSVKVLTLDAGKIECKIVNEETGVIDQEVSMSMGVYQNTTFTFTGIPDEGKYSIRIRMFDASKLIFQDAYYFTVININQLPSNYSVVAYPGEDGNLVYTPDFRGNRIPDFSGVGYCEGKDLPNVPVKMTLEPSSGDDTKRIQEAINAVSAMTPDKEGFRGALLLKKGTYEIGGTLKINASGVVLRGEGQGDFKSLWLDPAKGQSLVELKESLLEKEATVLIATGGERRWLIRMEGSGGVSGNASTATEIFDNYVPVGANTFMVNNAENFNNGDKIILERRGNALWINEIGMNAIPPRSDGASIVQWSPLNLQFEYVITAIRGNHITINSSIVNAIDKQWGGGRIYKYSDSGRINRSGVENLRAISFWKTNINGVDDTRHADKFLLLDKIRDGWAQNITLEHFYENAAVTAGRGSYGVTIQNSSTLIAPRTLYAGPGYDPSGRTFYETDVYVGRYGFKFAGQHGLVKNCYALHNRHAFVFDSKVTGPNVFVNCYGENSLTWSEPHHRWSVGGLYDNVKDMISLMNRLNYGSGHGWAGVNYVAWNTEGDLVCEQPPTAQNWTIGHTGKRINGPFHNWNLEKFGISYGYWDAMGKKVEPVSLYIRQVADKKGEIVSAPTREILPSEKKIDFYPNPSTGGGTIRFSHEKTGWCEIGLFDLSGKQLIDSLTKHFNKGIQEQSWDFGMLPNGIYLFRLRTNETVLSTKGVLNR